MNREEAIQYFNDEIRLCRAAPSINGCQMTEDWQRTIDACEIAVAAIRKVQELEQAEQDGRLVELPFVAMVEQSMQNGKMKPMGDQKHNGRYAVVYVDRNKWKSPLIDICGKPYQREEAEIRMAALDGKGGEG